jgi:hypothetical protein
LREEGLAFGIGVPRWPKRLLGDGIVNVRCPDGMQQFMGDLDVIEALG